MVGPLSSSQPTDPQNTPTSAQSSDQSQTHGVSSKLSEVSSKADAVLQTEMQSIEQQMEVLINKSHQEHSQSLNYQEQAAENENEAFALGSEREFSSSTEAVQWARRDLDAAEADQNQAEALDPNQSVNTALATVKNVQAQLLAGSLSPAQAALKIDQTVTSLNTKLSSSNQIHSGIGKIDEILSQISHLQTEQKSGDFAESSIQEGVNQVISDLNPMLSTSQQITPMGEGG